MELLKVFTKDPKWTKAIFTGKRKLNAGDRSEIEARRGGKIVTTILTALYSKHK